MTIFNLDYNVFTWCNIMQQCTKIFHPWLKGHVACVNWIDTVFVQNNLSKDNFHNLKKNMLKKLYFFMTKG